ncbi:MAG: GNAT family N-acetyltransferase [Halolamina sp.]|uniref:GNAT family N-acetyltransferase n=1 Tax=Halolamina sp. TaxID=1940283 RepID=UPI002FC29A1C
MIPPERVAAAEYAKRRVLATVTETQFGVFVHDAAHAHRAPATQLVDARLPSDGGAQVPDEAPGAAEHGEDTTVLTLLDRLDSLYDQYSFDHRILAGVDRETFARLTPVLRKRGYDRELYWALVPHLLDEPPDGPPGFRIEAKSHGSDDAQAVHEAVGRSPAGIAYAADIARALDGTELVGYRRGDPVGVAGWYVHNDGDDAVARFTHVGVHPDTEGQGIGSALVAAVVEHCPLQPGRLVVCATEGNSGFYEGLGFVRNNLLWRFARFP